MYKILELQPNQIAIIVEPDHKIRKLIHIWCETNNLDPNYHRSFVNNSFYIIGAMTAMVKHLRIHFEAKQCHKLTHRI